MEICECHGHVMMDGTDYRAARERHKNSVDTACVRRTLQAMREHGIRFYRDGGDALGVSLAARELAGEYGIALATPAFGIHKKGHYGGIVGRAYETMDDYRRLLDEAERQKADFIKLMLSGILTFRRAGELNQPSLEPEEIFALISLAHERGLGVMAHVNGDRAVSAAIEAGADSVEHGCFMEEPTLRRLAASRSVWVPTVAALRAFVGRAGFDRETCEAIVRTQTENIRTAVSLGAMIASGSDAGAVGVPHGAGIRTETELLQSAGVPPEDMERANRRICEIFINKLYKLHLPKPGI